jgi:hypothetical protein
MPLRTRKPKMEIEITEQVLASPIESDLMDQEPLFPAGLWKKGAPKTRKKRAAKPAVAPEAVPVAVPTGVRFVELTTANVIKMELDDGRDVRGAFVKLAPRLARSERAGFDGTEMVKALRARGAAAVSLTPIIIPDRSAAPEAKAKGQQRVDERDEVRSWFGDEAQRDPVVGEALQGCLQILDDVGF